MRMYRILFALLCAGLLLGSAAESVAIPFGGVEFPDGAISFADTWIAYSPGPGAGPGADDPAFALGPPDYTGHFDVNRYVSLGAGGILVLQFTDNSLTTSGDGTSDLWIFEAGLNVEAAAVSISVDGSSWIDVGSIGGSTEGIDIDSYVGPAGVTLWEQYSFVMLEDLTGSSDPYPYGGADIDAVGAISSAPPVTPVPEPATLFLLGGGLIALAGLRRKTVAMTGT